MPINVDVVVSISVFSGRPNPQWNLKQKDIEILKSKLKAIPQSKKEVIPPKLGFNGFKIYNFSKVSGIPKIMRVYKKFISYEENEKTIFLEDVNDIEEWLFTQAKELGYEDIVNKIEQELKNLTKD